MKPIIGICTNYSANDEIGIITDLGMRNQEWDLIAHDYVNAVESAGGTPLIIPVVNSIDTLDPILNILKGIIFTGGSDVDPLYYGEYTQYDSLGIETTRDEHEMKLLKKVLYEMRIPVLGICRGMQLLNVACMGKLYQDLQKQWGSDLCHSLEMYPKHFPAHDVLIEENSKLYSIFKKKVVRVNSLHHQGIRTVGDGFKVSMTAVDGLAEGIELPGDRFVVGVQFHPEMMVEKNPEYLILFEEFIKNCFDGKQ